MAGMWLIRPPPPFLVLVADPDSYNRILGCIRVLLDPKVGVLVSRFLVLEPDLTR